MLNLVPVLGSIVSLFLWPVMNYQAFRSVHRMGKVRATIAALLPYAVAAAAVGTAIWLGHKAIAPDDPCHL